MPIEERGTFVWLFAEGHVSRQAGREMIEGLRHIVRHGLWTQNWQRPQTDN